MHIRSLDVVSSETRMSHVFWILHGKNDFARVFKNVSGYGSENNFVELFKNLAGSENNFVPSKNNYIGRLN